MKTNSLTVKQLKNYLDKYDDNLKVTIGAFYDDVKVIQYSKTTVNGVYQEVINISDNLDDADED